MEKLLNEYIELVITKAINLQEGQAVYISSQIENYDFTIKLVQRLYEMGSSDVCVNWMDSKLLKLHLTYQSTERLEQVDNYKIEMYKSYVQRDAAFISISSSDPEALKGVDPQKVKVSTMATSKALAPYKDKIMADENSWCVISVPTYNWAKKVFPNETKPIEKLWEAILKAVKVEEGKSIKNWNEHIDKLNEMSELLNNYKFDKLKFESKEGTNLEVELVQDHIWVSAESTNLNLKNTFIANMPTEEIFTMPSKYGVNGKVVSTKPLNYNGALIENFYIEFKDGRAINWNAEKNNDVLTKLIESDEGSHYLGEVALVECDNPIAEMNLMFYNTLFDENASCHLAFGKSYPTTMVGGEKLSEKEREAVGSNVSIVHEDFMFGSDSLQVVGIKGDKEVLVMENGKFIK